MAKSAVLLTQPRKARGSSGSQVIAAFLCDPPTDRHRPHPEAFADALPAERQKDGSEVVGFGKALRHAPPIGLGSDRITAVRGCDVFDLRGILDGIFGSRRDEEDEWEPYEAVTRLDLEEARAALVATGLCKGRDPDVLFVQQVIDRTEYARGIDLRRRGTPVGPEQRRQLGVRVNVLLTAEYLEILTPAGLADPIDAAQLLVTAYLTRLASINSRGCAEQIGLTMVEVIPNNMAAGPCAACLSLAGKPIPIAEAPLGPLPGCPHPTQCKLWTRTVLSLD